MFIGTPYTLHIREEYVCADEDDTYSSQELQLRRLMGRDHSDIEAASARLRSQMPIAEKLQYADIVVDNSGSLQDLQIQVDSLVRRLHSEAGWSWRLTWLIPPFALISAIWTLFWRTVRRNRKAARRARQAK